ncbi:MAG: hypothetical protein H6621_11185 [Halobacteriovoraceae bacterium]|nr:hypothetical protein [Halobacteriovoraceae bacterium]MCB9095622.1 hypothetical protein [Halobacteriovoraceae bacterium]
MKHLLSTFLLFTIFLIQIHGIAHFGEDNHQQTHQCSVCEIQSHTLGVHPAAPELEPTPDVLYKFILFDSYQKFSPSFLSFHDIQPRAPPLS